MKGPPDDQNDIQQLGSFRKPSNLVLRSTLPLVKNADQTFYDPWMEWANYNEYQQWRKTNPWAVSVEQIQRYSPFPPMLNSGNFPQRGVVRQEIAGQPDYSGGISTYFTNPQQPKHCDECNGDCRNYLCYGCGGCPEPPPEQQLYYYPYQKQDAGLISFS